MSELKEFAQTGLLLKQNLKRDWVKITSWLVLLLGIFVIVAAKFANIYGTKQEIATIAQTLRSKAMVSIMGTIPAGQLTTAIIFSREMLIFWTLFLIIFNYLLAINASRGQEEDGLTEMLIGGYPVGKGAPLLAAVLELFVVNLLFMLLAVSGLTLAAMPGSSSEGNLLFAATLATAGFAFGSSALLFAQVSVDSRNVTLWAYSFLGLTYLSRMVSDTVNSHYTWLSPLGWVEKTALYTGENWLPFGLLIILSGVLLAVTFTLNQRRDLGAGLLHVNGHKTNSRFLRGPVSLLLWQEKGSLLIWIIGMAALGGSYGSIFNSFSKIANQTPVIQQVLGQSGIHHLQKQQLLGFIGVLGIVFSVLAVVAGILIMQRLYHEEKSTLVQVELTKPISKSRLFTIYSCGALLVAALLLFIALMTVMITANSVLKVPLASRYFYQTFAAFLPAVCLFITFSAFLVGATPKIRSLVWVYLSLAFMLSYLGPLADLPKWSLKLSPFYWAKEVPQHALASGPVFTLLAISVGLLIAGLISYNKRDLE